MFSFYNSMESEKAPPLSVDSDNKDERMAARRARIAARNAAAKKYELHSCFRHFIFQQALLTTILDMPSHKPHNGAFTPPGTALSWLRRLSRCSTVCRTRAYSRSPNPARLVTDHDIRIATKSYSFLQRHGDSILSSCFS